MLAGPGLRPPLGGRAPSWLPPPAPLHLLVGATLDLSPRPNSPPFLSGVKQTFETSQFVAFLRHCSHPVVSWGCDMHFSVSLR